MYALFPQKFTDEQQLRQDLQAKLSQTEQQLTNLKKSLGISSGVINPSE